MDKRNLGCINPHGHYPFPASREVCPECQAIQARLHAAVFTPRHGLRYRWWRDVRWDLVVSMIVILLLWGVAILVLAAWIFDMKPGDIPWV